MGRTFGSALFFAAEVRGAFFWTGLPGLSGKGFFFIDYVFWICFFYRADLASALP